MRLFYAEPGRTLPELAASRFSLIYADKSRWWVLERVGPRGGATAGRNAKFIGEFCRNSASKLVVWHTRSALGICRFQRWLYYDQRESNERGDDRRAHVQGASSVRRCSIY